VADLDEAEPATPLPLGRRTDAITHGTIGIWQQHCIMATPSPVYLFKHEKPSTQNIRNDCHQWLSDRFRVHQIRFRSGLPQALSWFKGPTS